jgi:hypothetical protein
LFADDSAEHKKAMTTTIRIKSVIIIPMRPPLVGFDTTIKH